MDKNLIEPAELMLRLFDGYERRHIITDLRNAEKNDAGKLNGSTRKVDGPLTVDTVTAHLNSATKTCGVSPMRADSTCSWGVLDIDWYDMPEKEVQKLPTQLKAICTAFRSKSGGVNVFVFASEPVRGRVMHDYLVSLRKRLPKKVRDKTEVFPAHSQTVVNPGDDPTSVHLPLNGTQRPCVFQLGNDGQLVWFTDDTTHSEVLTRIDAFGCIDADTMTQMSAEAPTLDASEIGYRVPDNPAGRNDLLLRIAASMQSRGWPDSELEAEIRRLNGDTKFHDLFIGKNDQPHPLTENEIKNILKRTKRLDKGTPTPLHYRQIEKFNRDWAVIDLGGKIEYLRKSAGEFMTYKSEDLFAKTAMQQVQLGKMRVPLAKLWMQDPDRAEFEGVVVEPEDYDGPGYNVFRGFKVAPKDGDASVIERYILEVLCSGDDALAHWVTMWLADAIQRPTEPSVSTAIALRGPQGAGKSFLQEKVLTAIFDDRQMHVVHESKRLFGQFNRNLFGCTIIACEESIFHGSKQDADTLKSFISSPGWVYEEKYKATFRAKNVHRLIATTNSEHAVHVERDDRRWTVIEVQQPFDMTTAEGQNEAYAYWEPYHAFMNSEDGAGIVLRYLLNYKVDRKALTFAHGTDAKARDKVMSDPVLAVLHEIAEDGFCPDDVKAAGVVSVKSLAREVQKKPGGKLLSGEEIAARVQRFVRDAETVRNARYVTGFSRRVDDGHLTVMADAESRQRGRQLGTLQEFRDAIAHVTKVDYDDGKSEWHAWCVPDDVHELPF